MPDNQSNTTPTQFSSSAGSVYTPSNLGENLQSTTKVVGAYGQYQNNSNTSLPSSSQPQNKVATKLAGLKSQATAQHVQQYTRNGKPIPQGQSIHQAVQNSQPLTGNQPQYHMPIAQGQQYQQAPTTYVNNSVNQYKRPVAPPQNRPVGMTGGQVFPTNKQPYTQTQRPQQPQQPKKPGFFSGLFGSPSQQKLIKILLTTFAVSTQMNFVKKSFKPKLMFKKLSFKLKKHTVKAFLQLKI
jgi:hypothetical protein